MSGAAIDKCCGPVHSICRKALLRSSRHAAERYQVQLDSLKGQLERSERSKDSAELRPLNMQKQRQSGRRRRRPHSAAQVRRSTSAPFFQSGELPVGAADPTSSEISCSIDTSVGEASKYEVELSTPSLLGKDFGLQTV